jgi:hypothetical protein
MSYYSCRCGIRYNLSEGVCPKCRREPIIEDTSEYDEDDEYAGKNSTWWQSLKALMGLTRKPNNESNNESDNK